MNIYVDVLNIKKTLLSLPLVFILIYLYLKNIDSLSIEILASLTVSFFMTIVAILWFDPVSPKDASEVWIISWLAFISLRLDFSSGLKNMVVSMLSIRFLLDSLIWIAIGLFVINFTLVLKRNETHYKKAEHKAGRALLVATTMGIAITCFLTGLSSGSIFILKDTYMIPIFYGLIVLFSQFNFFITRKRGINGVVIVILIFSVLSAYRLLINSSFPPFYDILIELLFLILFFVVIMKPEEKDGKYTGSVISYPHYRIKISLIFLWFIILYFSTPRNLQIVDSTLIFPMIFFSEFVIDLIKGIHASGLSGKGGIIGGAGLFDSLYSTFSFTIATYLVFQIIISGGNLTYAAFLF